MPSASKCNHSGTMATANTANTMAAAADNNTAIASAPEHIALRTSQPQPQPQPARSKTAVSWHRSSSIQEAASSTKLKSGSAAAAQWQLAVFAAALLAVAAAWGAAMLDATSKHGAAARMHVHRTDLALAPGASPSRPVPQSRHHVCQRRQPPEQQQQQYGTPKRPTPPGPAEALLAHVRAVLVALRAHVQTPPGYQPRPRSPCSSSRGFGTVLRVVAGAALVLGGSAASVTGDAFVYEGCYTTGAEGRQLPQPPPVRIQYANDGAVERCEQAAVVASSAFFGIEYPEGFVAPAQLVRCLLMNNVFAQTHAKVANAECQARQGSSSSSSSPGNHLPRIAVYRRAVPRRTSPQVMVTMEGRTHPCAWEGVDSEGRSAPATGLFGGDRSYSLAACQRHCLAAPHCNFMAHSSAGDCHGTATCHGRGRTSPGWLVQQKVLGSTSERAPEAPQVAGDWRGAAAGVVTGAAKALPTYRASATDGEPAAMDRQERSARVRQGAATAQPAEDTATSFPPDMLPGDARLPSAEAHRARTARGEHHAIEGEGEGEAYQQINGTFNAAVQSYLSNPSSAAATYGEINTWDAGMVTTMRDMFAYARAFDQNINGWDTSLVTTMQGMFSWARAFNQNINAWDVRRATTMSFMFDFASAFNQNINAWDTSQVTTMESMFSYARAFNQNTNAWDVRQVITMMGMFAITGAFNQNINGWDVRRATTMSRMFTDAIAFNQNINAWDTSQVTTMESMFSYTITFNQDINAWDVRQVTSMKYMFIGAVNSANVFHQNINAWDVRQVITMVGMFSNAQAFDQNINAWDTSRVTAMAYMFSYARVFNQTIHVP